MKNINDLKNTITILDNLNYNTLKANNSDNIKKISEDLLVNIKNYFTINKSEITTDEQNLIKLIIDKIDIINNRVLPKSNIFKSFSESFD